MDILHRIGTTAPLDDVYRALATIDGLAAWWTTDTTGAEEVGGKVAFRFGDAGSCAVEVLALDPAGEVRWRVVDGPDEWIDTEVAWHLSTEDGLTIVLFEHLGWREAAPFMAHCSTKWATFLLSLKALVETGTGRPAPHDLRISNWH